MNKNEIKCLRIVVEHRNIRGNQPQTQFSKRYKKYWLIQLHQLNPSDTIKYKYLNNVLMGKFNVFNWTNFQLEYCYSVVNKMQTEKKIRQLQLKTICLMANKKIMS